MTGDVIRVEPTPEQQEHVRRVLARKQALIEMLGGPPRPVEDLPAPDLTFAEVMAAAKGAGQ